MGTEVVRRRMNTIASHFAVHTLPTTHLLTMNLNTFTPRRDNKMFFARQDATSQASFMKQGNSEKQVSCVHPKSPTSNHKNKKEQPLFSRPTNMNSNLPSTNIVSTKNPIPKRDSILSFPDHPTFARPNTDSSAKNLSYSSQFDGVKWSPRMDVVDYRNKYVVTVELAGVSVNDIRVEVHDQNLIIKGKRPRQSRRVYQRKEILKGSFNIVWPLPFDAKKDTISADFLDGFLRVNILKS